VMKLLTGIGDPLVGYILTFDALEMKLRKVKIPRNERCSVCSAYPTIVKLLDEP